MPDAEIPIPALTAKDRRDLEFAMEHGADWIGLSFVQRPEDIVEAKALMQGRGLPVRQDRKAAGDPAAGRDHRRGRRDHGGARRSGGGAEPRRSAAAAEEDRQRQPPTGKPVIVATQMLESMIESPIPTRAEVSDVANAVYDGADVVMLSAETAAGQWPEEAVLMMDLIARHVEADEGYKARVRMLDTPPDATTADALAHACMTIGDTISLSAICVFTSSGSTARRVARERPGRAGAGADTVDCSRPPRLAAVGRPCRRHQGYRQLRGDDRQGQAHGAAPRFRRRGCNLAMLAGVPFGKSGATNLLHIVRLAGDELDEYEHEPD